MDIFKLDMKVKVRSNRAWWTSVTLFGHSISEPSSPVLGIPHFECQYEAEPTSHC